MASIFRRRDPWWELEGAAARRRRRRDSVVAAIALVISLAAVAGAAFAWSIQLGLATSFGLPAGLGVG